MTDRIDTAKERKTLAIVFDLPPPLELLGKCSRYLDAVDAKDREIERLRSAIEQFATEENWLLEGPFDVKSVTFYGESFARAALNQEEDK